MSNYQIPQAERDAIAHIQALALPVSTHSQGGHWVSVDFSGMLLQLNVSIGRRSDLHNPTAVSQTYSVYLPPCQRAPHDALEQLQAIARDLEALLPGVVAA
ncbi:hypothetical protein [Halomonas sp. TD01]|uniref:hypothetical protein n=1 Tax=Halomonas sp. TD01 TaxID=999141 RepID=UPI000214E28D|nr:hypothetical protein [Halomonas sp. TD01]EGP20388.1 hypothetical protein GME_06719 [Halomonas sp. TD01]CAH1041528.1 hypothetical protein HPTD01_6 [Halomonas sp. TD01]